MRQLHETPELYEFCDISVIRNGSSHKGSKTLNIVAVKAAVRCIREGPLSGSVAGPHYKNLHRKRVFILHVTMVSLLS